VVRYQKLLLASSSPRRRDLLREAGYDFEVQEPGVDEPAGLPHDLSAQQQAEALAYFKARQISDTCSDRWILAADTIVASSAGEIMGKPSDVDDARRMLMDLSGSSHAVITGVAIIEPSGVRHLASSTTNIKMRPMKDGELDDYIASGEWIGKSGAYAIQETGDRFITKVDGSFSNVVGLPMELVGRMLIEAGWEGGS